MNRYDYINKANKSSIIGNTFLLIIKLAVGLLSKSSAMISDAINSMSDIFATIMSFIGERIARIPEDDSHNFGHGKAEYIFSLIISISMVAVSIKLIYSSILSLISPHQINYIYLLIITSLITIIVKLILFIYTKKVNKKVDSILVKSLLKDHRNDIFLTTGTLISSLSTIFNIYYLDGIVGIIISLFISYSGIKIFISSYDTLMDKSIDNKTKNKILSIIDKYDEIKKINHFTTTPVGYKFLVSISIFVDGNMTTFRSHDIADTLEKEINKLDKVYLAIIHVNPI